MAQQIYTIGVTGGSGSGKTSFIQQLARHFTTDEICLLCQDDYYKPRDHQETDEKGIKNFDLPTAIERESFHQDILTLKRGESIERKEYTYNNPAIVPKNLTIKPAPILIVEGLFIQYFPEVEQELDLSIFIEAKDYLKLSRRIRRDNEERGYDLEDVLYRYHYHVMPVYETLIEPQKHKADIVIPNNHHFEKALNLIVHAIRHKLDTRK